MFGSKPAARRPTTRRSREPTGEELLADAVAEADAVLMLLGDPPSVVPGRLYALGERHLSVTVGAHSLADRPAHGHLVLVQLMRDGRSVAFHARVDSVEPSGRGPVLMLDRPERFLVVQARRAFRIPVKGLGVEIELDFDGSRAGTLLALSLGGIGVQVVGKPLAVGAEGSVQIRYEEQSVVVAVHCLAVHGDVHGFEILQGGDLEKERLRKFVMGVERSWMLRQRRVR